MKSSLYLCFLRIIGTWYEGSRVTAEAPP